MSSSGSSTVEEQHSTDVLFKREVLSESTIEPPMDEWSSLDISETFEESPKMAAYKLGQYHPGSGEICAKYIAMSDSDVLNHVYYAYPNVKDPGIFQALTLPEPPSYFDPSGQELYMALCEEMKIIPVRCFHRSLVESEINLKYYGVNPVGVRAMCLSLVQNRYVRRLDLTCNYLSDDACFHLGQLLRDNVLLDELVLAQCKIGPSGIRRVVANLSTRAMDLLDLSSTEMGETGLQYLAAAIMKGGVIRRLNLSHNKLGTESSVLFADAIEFNNSITHLDLSWNELYSPKGSTRLLRVLSESQVLSELNLSWNSLTIGVPLRKLLMLPNLRVLDLSNNSLYYLFSSCAKFHTRENYSGDKSFIDRIIGAPASKAIALRLKNAARLEILDLSYNPWQPSDALRVLQQMKLENVRVEQLLMADIGVSKEFIVALKEILELPHRSKTTVTHGRVLRDYTLTAPDLRRIVLRRLDYLFARSTRKCRVDIGLYIMEQRKQRGANDSMTPQELIRFMKQNGLTADEDLIEELVNLFPGPKDDKGKRTIGLRAFEDYIHRLWPEKVLPSTPPPLPLPPPPSKEGKKSKKNKKTTNTTRTL